MSLTLGRVRVSVDMAVPQYDRAARVAKRYERARVLRKIQGERLNHFDIAQLAVRRVI